VTLRGPDGVPSEIIAANVDAFDRWSADLDRREDRVASTRYVSPQMTGYEDLDSYGTWRTMPEYGAVWVPAVAAGWAPYRYGHWVWIEPWGWSWVDDAPWGFAPFHYGRWVWLHNRETGICACTRRLCRWLAMVGIGRFRTGGGLVSFGLARALLALVSDQPHLCPQRERHPRQ
jgi:hypothetical protein